MGFLGIKLAKPASQCLSPKSAQRFWDNDMHKNKDLKRAAAIQTRRASSLVGQA
jgi:hypothetical protein